MGEGLKSEKNVSIQIYPGNAFSLTNAWYSLINFQTAYKMTSQPSILAWTTDKKNTKSLYFGLCKVVFRVGTNL